MKFVATKSRIESKCHAFLISNEYFALLIPKPYLCLMVQLSSSLVPSPSLAVLAETHLMAYDQRCWSVIRCSIHALTSHQSLYALLLQSSSQYLEEC